MNKYEMIYESICDLYDEGILTEEEAEELNETAYEKYVEEKTRFEKEYEKNPKAIKKYLTDRNERLDSEEEELEELREKLYDTKPTGLGLFDKDHDNKIKKYEKSKKYIDKMIEKNRRLNSLNTSKYIDTNYRSKKRSEERHKPGTDYFKPTYNYGDQKPRKSGRIKDIYDNMKKSSVDTDRLSELKRKYNID